MFCRLFNASLCKLLPLSFTVLLARYVLIKTFVLFPKLRLNFHIFLVKIIVLKSVFSTFQGRLQILWHGLSVFFACLAIRHFIKQQRFLVTEANCFRKLYLLPLEHMFKHPLFLSFSLLLSFINNTLRIIIVQPILQAGCWEFLSAFLLLIHRFILNHKQIIEQSRIYCDFELPLSIFQQFIILLQQQIHDTQCELLSIGWYQQASNQQVVWKKILSLQIICAVIFLALINNIQYQRQFQETPMCSNTSQAFYTKSLHQETQQLPLRSRAFSQLDNIPHQPPHRQSYNAHLSEDKVSQIKKKYDKSYTPNNSKPPKQSIPPSGSTLSFGKNILRYEAHDENNTWSPYKEPSRIQRSLNDQTGCSAPYGMQKMSYGRPSAKSELQNGLSALNSMKSELKSKLNDLASKNTVNASQFIKEHQFKEMKQSNLNNSYDLIVSKYSRTNGLSENEGLQTNFSKYRPEYVTDKNMPQLEIPSGSGFPYNYSFANKSTILERQSCKIDSLPMNQPKSNQYNFTKQNRIPSQSQDLYKKNTQKIGQSLMVPDRNEKRTVQDSKIPNQKTALSYMNAQKDRTRQQQRNNFEFTLRKNDEVNKSYIKPTDNPTHNQSLKYEPRTDNYTKYEIKNTKATNNKNEQQSAKVPYSPYKGETRDSAVISRQIQKLDLKIKQIEQNKKALNISFSPYSQSKSTNKISATPKQNPKHQISTYERQETRSISPIFSNTTKNSVDVERKRPNFDSRHQDILKTNATVNQSMPFQSIRNRQRPLSIPFTPAESHNDDDQQTSERSNADMSFESKKLNCSTKNADDYGMQDRKKQMQSRLQASNIIKGLVKALGEQVALDEAFRNNKIWFASENSERKWALLKKELQSIGANISQSMLKDIFSLEESQNNPFFSVSDSKCTMQSLAQSYLQGQSHWDQKINRKFRKADLEKEGLNSQKIDYERKGFIEVEDLVRFLNLQSGTFFRLRDVSLIFKRVTKKNQMQFSDLLDVVSA